MNYWWVNHKQTFKQEISGGYMWSPKHRADGASSHYYENMTKVKPGDIIFSFAGGEIRVIGTATDRASSASKPSEFGSTGDNWSNDGWFVPVDFKYLEKPFRPKNYMDYLAPLLPQKYSPIQANGNGNQAAYLSSISNIMANRLFELIDEQKIVNQLIGAGISSTMEEKEGLAEAELRNQADISATEKEQIIKSRRGQGIFRSRVESIEVRCRVTGLMHKEHLRASHIKPWRDSTNQERLDGNNGLLLAPHIDHLFDRGWITFNEHGKICVSDRLAPSVLVAWSIKVDVDTGSFNTGQQSYLEWHRNNVFQR